MIGPSSGTNDVQNHETARNSIRMKRKALENSSVNEFCQDTCQDVQKRCMTESEAPRGEILTEILDSHFSPMPLEEAGSIARLEVLVVDGHWDIRELEGANFTDFNQSDAIDSNGQISTEISEEFVNQDLNDLQNCWELSQTIQIPTIKPTSNRGHQLSQLQDNNINEDQENKNLSWLLDFRLDSFIEATDDRTVISTSRNTDNSGQRNKLQTNNQRTAASTSFFFDSKKACGYENSNSGYRRDIDNNTQNISHSNGPKKPPFTYTELIEKALQEKGELTVSAIYQWISEHFPFYKCNDDRWKNSVRHNLSINPHFRKGSKAPHGAGHLWAIANQDDSRSRHIFSNGVKQVLLETNNNRKSGISSQIVTFEEVEAATASITQPPDEETEKLINSVTLEHCAEQILSGVKKNVEVQYLVPMSCEGENCQQGSDEQFSSSIKETVIISTNFILLVETFLLGVFFGMAKLN